MTTRPDFVLEGAYEGAVFGLDEVGRGPLAGPVVAACVYVPREHYGHPVWREARDSKQLTAARRDVLDAVIKGQSRWAIGMASVDEIDTLNILQATFLAMRRAVEQMGMAPVHLLIDGNRLPKNWPWSATAIVKGDGKSVSIAAASIIAKVARDTLMEGLAKEYPPYDWAGNAGYGTPAHLAALAQYGPTPHHRRSFAPVRAMVEKKAG